MIFLAILFKISFCDCADIRDKKLTRSLDEDYVLNLTQKESYTCINIYNSVFNLISSTAISVQSMNSVLIKSCYFNSVQTIISNQAISDSFTFEENCISYGGESAKDFIDPSGAKNVKFLLNTISSLSQTLNIITINYAKKIEISNTNISNSRGDSAISISINNESLKFVDTTMLSNTINPSLIVIYGFSSNYGIDRINAYERSSKMYNLFQIKNKGKYLVTRAFSNLKSTAENDCYLVFADSIMIEFIASKIDNSFIVECDMCDTTGSSYPIIHLNNEHCHTNIYSVEIPKNTVGTSMILKLSFSVIGGALLAVAVFIALIVVIKLSVKWYQKKESQKHPVFDIE